MKCDYCKEEFIPRQRFCSGKCRAYSHRSNVTVNTIATGGSTNMYKTPADIYKTPSEEGPTYEYE